MFHTYFATLVFIEHFGLKITETLLCFLVTFLGYVHLLMSMLSVFSRNPCSGNRSTLFPDRETHQVSVLFPECGGVLDC